MTRTEELNAFFANMYNLNVDMAKSTDGYEYRKIRQEHIEEMLESNLTYDQQRFVEEILFELYSAAESDAKRLYQQGSKDGIWLLRYLGVLS